MLNKAILLAYAPLSATVFPEVVSVTPTSFAAATTSHSVQMDATVDADDLLIAITSFREGADGIVSVTPGGWTSIWNPVDANHEGNGYARIADGTEGGTTVDFQTSRARTGCALVYRIRNWFGNIANGIDVSSINSQSTATPNPPSLSPSWGSAKTLWIAVATGQDDDAGINTYPANYTNGVHTISGGGANNGASISTARRELKAASENPGVFNWDQSELTYALVVGIRPAA
ncbi:MAG TPA: hypothetical protein EYH07_17370 [Kiloniellaceae bacterium]|nr:hypothetical protein [Kiloniellaceae bacterium]